MQAGDLALSPHATDHQSLEGWLETTRVLYELGATQAPERQIKSGGALLRDSIMSHYIEVSTNARPPLHAPDGAGRNAR